MSHIAERVLVGSLQKFSVEDGPGIRTTILTANGAIILN